MLIIYEGASILYVIYMQVYFNSSVIKLFQITITSVIYFVFQFSSKALFYNSN